MIAIAMYLTSRKNYMPGKEYGTAKFADIKQVNQVLAEKDETENPHTKPKCPYEDGFA